MPTRNVSPPFYRIVTGMLLDAVEDGLVSEATITEKAVRIVYASRAVQFHPDGGQFDFARSPARTTHPHGAYM